MVKPAGDQLMIMSSAYRLRLGNIRPAIPGGYLDIWKNQIGLTLIEYYCGFIFGDYNATAFQIANCLGVVLLYKKITDIMDYWKISKTSQILTLLLGILFTPFIMYTTFAYGTILSIAFAIAAFDSEMRFFSEGKPIRLILSVLLMVLAYQIKNNVLIITIAMAIYAVIMSLQNKQLIKRGIAFIILLFATFIATQNLTIKIIYDKTGFKLNQGASAWSFIAMGMQESNYAPGWYNGYNVSSYVENEYNTEKQSKVAKENISERLAIFKNDKHYAFQFFSKKIASMWNEPTYQSLWVTQTREHNTQSEKLNNFLSANSYTTLNNILGFLQLFVFLGCILWLLLEPKECFINKSFFILCIIGGFFFHLVWEAKSQYSINYVVLMLPLAALGFELLINSIAEKKDNHNLKDTINNTIRHINVSVLILFIVVAIMYAGIYLLDGSHCLTSDNTNYELYLEMVDNL